MTFTKSNPMVVPTRHGVIIAAARSTGRSASTVLLEALADCEPGAADLCEALHSLLCCVNNDEDMAIAADAVVQAAWDMRDEITRGIDGEYA